MTLLPVIGRELRASARHSFTYYLRAMGAAAAVLASLLFGLSYGFEPDMGGALFAALHMTLFCAIWLFVPLLAADCISRERREGTLGLLFLTRLKAGDIVAAKGLVHGLRAITLWLAILPVSVIPVLLGGVGASEAMLSVLVNFSAMCWALAAGLLGSAWSKAWLRALLNAAVLAFLFLMGLGAAAGCMLSQALSSATGGGALPGYLSFAWIFLLAAPRNVWAMFMRGFPTGQLLWGVGELAVLSFLALGAAVLLAGRKTSRTWQERPPSAFQLWWQATFCTPVLWVSLFRRWMRHKLDRNPVGWLEQRTWSGRVVTWGWLAVVISLYSAALTDPNFFRGYNAIQTGIAWLLVGSLALSAAGSFRRERETGVLELLLVSPLRESQLILGRLRGLWGQFFLAFGLLIGVWAYFMNLAFLRPLPENHENVKLLFFAVTFLALPVIGLYFSLRCRNFIAGFLLTLFAGLLGPLVVPSLLAFLLSLSGLSHSWLPNAIRPSFQGAVCQLALAALCGWRLYGALRKRTFPLGTAERAY